MNYSYIQAVGKGFPLVQCHANGRGEQYAELVWDSGDALPSQATLDAWIAANPIPTDQDVSGFRINSTTGIMEYWNGTIWVEVSTAVQDIDSICAIYSGLTAATSGTSTIPADSTIPLSSEGTQLWAQTVTPASANSRFKFNQTLTLDCGSSSKSITIALFRGTTCIYAFNTYMRTAGQPVPAALEYLDWPNTDANVVYSVRVGVNSSSTWYVNQNNTGAITYGGTANRSTWTIMEAK